MGYSGYYPQAYEEDGSLTRRYDYVWTDVYDEHGNLVGNLPIIFATQAICFYEDPDAEGLEEFFNPVLGFFNRIGRTVDLVVEIVKTIFLNLKYLLPWNNTVPRGV